MRLVPSPPPSASERAGTYTESRRAFGTVVERLNAFHGALGEFIRAADPSFGTEARKLFDEYGEIIEAVRALADPVHKEPQRALAHGLAFGLWFAGRPELVRDCPEHVRRHLWTLPFDGREDLIKAATRGR